MSVSATLEAPALKRAWYLAHRPRPRERGPYAAQVCGLPLVLFRSEQGWEAAIDRCPHRGAPLSGGRVFEGGLECPYHGWRFGAQGRCLAVPASTRAAPKGRAHGLEVRPVREQQGFLWVCPDAETPEGDPPRFPCIDDPQFASVVHQADMPASLVATAENILDVPHTAFLHGGWFRGPPARTIRAEVSRDNLSAQARFHGEPAPGGVLGHLLAPGAKQVEHVDRFRLPSLAEVEYALGSNRLVITSALTPIDAENTRITAVASLRLRWGATWIARIVGPVARRVLRQDAEMLDAIAKNVARLGPGRQVSTEVDLLGPHISRLLRDQARGVETPPFEREIELLV